MIDPLMLSLSALPRVPFADMLALPEKQAVYFALDDTGKPLYIGATRGLRSRWQGHHLKQQLSDHECATIAYILCEGEELHELRQLETTMIEYFNPPCNGAWQRRMPSPRHERINVSFSISQTTWLRFRVACIERKIPFANRELERLIAQQLAAWQHQSQKETDHA